MREIGLIVLIIMFAAGPHSSAQTSERARVFRMDTVALIDQAKEIEGKVDHQQQQGRYLYLFASAENLNTFKANPAKYEIQQGGACGRMGPLSGEGSTKLFAVHEGRLYLFASEQCKRTFVATPQKFIERDEPPPATDAELLRKGEIMITMIAANAGLLRKSDPPVTLRQTLTRTEESGGKTYVVKRTVMLLLPDGVRDETCWSDSCWTNSARGKQAWTVDSGGAEALGSIQRLALLREAGRQPWMLAAQRNKPGFIAVCSGERRIVRFEDEAEQECGIVTVHWGGASTTLALDGAGRCRVMSYRGRGPDATFGDIEHIYSAFHIPDRHELPGHVETTFNGQRVAELSGDYSNQAVNDPADRRAFERPDALRSDLPALNTKTPTQP